MGRKSRSFAALRMTMERRAEKSRSFAARRMTIVRNGGASRIRFKGAHEKGKFSGVVDHFARRVGSGGNLAGADLLESGDQSGQHGRGRHGNVVGAEH